MSSHRQAAMKGAILIAAAAWLALLTGLSGLPAGLDRVLAAGLAGRAAGNDSTARAGELVAGISGGLETPELGALLAANQETIVSELPELGAILLAVPAGTESAAISSLRRSGLFRYVERNAIFRTPVPPAGETPHVEAARDLAFTPNDPGYASQWNLPRVRAPQAWDISRGSSTVLVGVIDSGYDLGHPDQPLNFTAGPDYLGEGSVTLDDVGHGTHVTGIIAARAGNGVGVSGLAPNVSVAALRVGDSNGVPVFYVASAVRWATDAGAKVLNLSLGGTSDVAILRDAVAYAVGRGVLIVAASGNCGVTGPYCETANPVQYPAAYPGVLTVGATDWADRVATYSGHHDYVSVVAPGTSIYSSVPRAFGSYDYMSGTSMAAPHVTALAALVWSVNPSLTSKQVRCAIEETAVDLGTRGKDDYYGWGRIDAAAAVTAVRSPLLLGGIRPMAGEMLPRLHVPAVFAGVRRPC